MSCPADPRGHRLRSGHAKLLRGQHRRREDRASRFHGEGVRPVTLRRAASGARPRRRRSREAPRREHERAGSRKGEHAAVNRIVSYDLDTGARVRSVDVSAAAQLNDVTASPGGDLYASDTRGGAIFRIRGDAGSIDTLAAPGTLPGANGLALSSDGAALYVGPLDRRRAARAIRRSAPSPPRDSRRARRSERSTDSTPTETC